VAADETTPHPSLADATDTFSRKGRRKKKAQDLKAALPSPLAGEGVMQSMTDEGFLLPTPYSLLSPALFHLIGVVALIHLRRGRH